jgi:diacylglycerol kinase family enzyme
MSEVRPLEVRQVAAYYKPVGERAEDILAQAELFRTNCFSEYNVGVHLYPTEPDVAGTAESIQENVGEDTAIVVFAGDGSSHDMLEALVRLKSNTPVTAGPGGNACDLAHQLHTRQALRHPEQIIARGHQKELRPLRILAQRPDQTSAEETFAFGYWGTRMSAEGVAAIATPEFRESVKDLSAPARFLHEANIVYGALRRASTVTVRDGEHTRNIIELNVLNGSREAKTMHVPTVHLLRPRAHVTEIHHPNLPSLLIGLARATLRPLAVIEQGTELTYTLQTEDGDLPVQADGEVTHYPSGTVFTFSLGAQAVNAITTRGRS